MPNQYGEIEIGLNRVQLDAYEVELRVTDPESHAEISPARGQIGFKFDKLLALQLEPAGYGAALTDQLFQDEKIRALYNETKAAFRDRDLRIRLLIGQSAPELHALRWELLLDPGTRTPLATSERIIFSRYMLSRDWRGIRLRPKKKLQALIAVSAPINLADYGLAEIDKGSEIARAGAALKPLEPRIAGADEPLTIDRLIEAMRDGVDILYLVCHGSLGNGGEPCLYLQKDDGTVDLAKAGDLATRIGELTEAPRLIVLASCESAGDGTPKAQSALAPRLAEAGVPAVLAMQGKIGMETIEKAMPVFFSELLKDGQIDRALTVARGAVRHRPDSWMPVLFLRLKNGRIWYEPGFAGEAKKEFAKWNSICAKVKNGEFIPILGPDLAEDLTGGSRELAGRLAEEHQFPLAEAERADLAKVAQYIGTSQDRDYVQDTVQKQFQSQVAARVGNPTKENPGKTLADLALERCLSKEDHPYTILSGLKASIYINAGLDRMLLRSLQKVGKEPEEVIGSWRRKVDKVPRAPEPRNIEPTVQSPWVYQIFGRLGDEHRDTLVLTEDDFLDYLVATSTYKLMPITVRGELVENSLLFLGFNLDELRFRVLFRLIMTMEGTEGLRDLSHVGVQVNPDEHSPADIERAKKYIESYFQEGRGGSVSISIYWGAPADFLGELRRRLAEMPDEGDDSF